MSETHVTAAILSARLQQVIRDAEARRLVVEPDASNRFVDFSPTSYNRFTVLGRVSAVPIDLDVASGLSPEYPLISVSTGDRETDTRIEPLHLFVKFKQRGVHLRQPIGKPPVVLIEQIGKASHSLAGQENIDLSETPAMIRLGGKRGYPIRIFAREDSIRFVLRPKDV